MTERLPIDPADRVEPSAGAPEQGSVPEVTSAKTDAEAAPAQSTQSATSPAEPNASPPQADPPSQAEPNAPLLMRLNQRGFRLLMAADAIVLIVVTYGVMFYRFGTDWPTYSVPMYLTSFTLAIVVLLGSLYFGGMYNREPRLGAPPALPRVARQTLSGGGLIAVAALGSTGFAQQMGWATAGRLPFPILNLVAVTVLATLGVSANRALAMWLRTRREGAPKVVVVGDDTEVETAQRHLKNDHESVDVVATTDDPAALASHIADTGATDVMLLSGRWLDQLYPQLQALEQQRVTVLLRVSALETMYGLERIREVGGMPFVLVRAQTVPRSRKRFKRVFDLSLLLLIAPFALVAVGLTALYQLIVAGRPLLFRQERVGADRRPFQMVKFRTMVVDAESDGKGARLAEADDPRVIGACRWIRATRLDELPQLWNILKGEMSLVGPRPERPELTSAFEQDIVGYSRRYELPPGLTGLAQIHGRYHTDAEYKLGYDLQYLVNWSPLLDLEILFRTVWVVLARRV